MPGSDYASRKKSNQGAQEAIQAIFGVPHVVLFDIDYPALRPHGSRLFRWRENCQPRPGRRGLGVCDPLPRFSRT
jgi:hypothetical protein